MALTRRQFLRTSGSTSLLLMFPSLAAARPASTSANGPATRPPSGLRVPSEMGPVVLR
ncbi:hypothetical protein [Salinicola avicenniae]|uniref:hypothetical protein n=1 Tax=Salinicola avicenniae TaxID=2916836 RepID=UPI0020730E6F|nr:MULTISPECIES: hypothetical protein [unclassified Salinicola]